MSQYIVVSIIAIGILVFLVWSAADIGSNIYVKTICELPTEEKKVALTFDDGPENGVTEEVLEVLKEYGVTATFFCIGEKISRNSAIFKHILTNGHTLGNHSYHHKDNFSILLPQQMRVEIDKCSEIITNLSGKEVRYFRPPLGVTNPMLALALRGTTMKVIGWNVRPFDTSLNDAEEVFRRVKKKLKPGSIILLHDRMKQTPQALRLILDYLKKENYKVVNIEEFIN